MGSVTTGLNPAQWNLLLRLHLRDAAINDVRAWMLASGANGEDVLGLWDKGLVAAEYGSFPSRELHRYNLADLLFRREGPAYGFLVFNLSQRARAVIRTRLAPQHAALCYLSNFETGAPLRKVLSKIDADAETLVPLDAAGFIQVFTSEFGAPRRVLLETVVGHRFDVQLRITTTGRKYIAN